MSATAPLTAWKTAGRIEALGGIGRHRLNRLVVERLVATLQTVAVGARGHCDAALTKFKCFEKVSLKFREDFLTLSPGVDLRRASANAL
jgi:hypothetical protein